MYMYKPNQAICKFYLDLDMKHTEIYICFNYQIIIEQMKGGVLNQRF